MDESSTSLISSASAIALVNGTTNPFDSIKPVHRNWTVSTLEVDETEQDEDADPVKSPGLRK